MAAGDKNVEVGTATTLQQCLRAGLLDDIHIDLVTVILGEGVRLFDHLPPAGVDLEITSVVEAPVVTQLRYAVFQVGTSARVLRRLS